MIGEPVSFFLFFSSKALSLLLSLAGDNSQREKESAFSRKNADIYRNAESGREPATTRVPAHGIWGEKLARCSKGRLQTLLFLELGIDNNV